MEIKYNFSLKDLNTFAIDAKAKYFVTIKDPDELYELIELDFFKENKHLILGGGSNILFQSDFDGLVIHMAGKGIKVVDQDDEFVFVKANAGEIWDDFVAFCVGNGFGGTENLSLIPGTVGASPVQNIGAYGVEIKDIVSEVEIFRIDTKKIEILKNVDCNFDYRDSIFKNALKNKIIVTSVTYKLAKNPELNLSYKELNNRMSAFENPDIKNVRDTVINIRTEKLPDPAVIPNAGSFFKNPVVSKEEMEKLKSEFPQLVTFPMANDQIKLAAGQLIDICGWKTRQDGKVAVHPKQALVIINKNNASGKEIIEFANAIRESVYYKFGVNIEHEVNII
ncbi:MAG: UDP-N-acetylmuramate dehydrogenase [Deltaproteobacteria bacterium]